MSQIPTFRNPTTTSQYFTPQSSTHSDEAMEVEGGMVEERTVPFAYYMSTDGMITFLQDHSSNQRAIKAEIPGQLSLVPVQLPNLPNLNPMLSITAKIQQLIKNVHLEPIYDGENVIFKPISPQNKVWEVARVKALQFYSITDWFVRSDGTIAYLDNNYRITTWNWISDSSTDEGEFAKGQQIQFTSFAELADGSLILGDNEGKLYHNQTLIFESTNLKRQIVKILPINSNCCLLEFQYAGKKVVNYQTQEILGGWTDSTECYVVKGSALLVLQDSQLSKFEFSEGVLKESDHPYRNKKIGSVQQISPTQFLVFLKYSILHQGKPVDYQTVDVWDVERDITRSYSDPNVVHKLKKPVIALDKETLCIDASNRKGRDSCYISLLSKEGNLLDSLSAGNWGIVDMLALSDGSVIYITDAGGAAIHIINKEGALFFSKSIEKLLGQDMKGFSLKELIDGSVAIKFRSQIVILKPKIENSKNKKYQIKKLELEIKYHPDQLNLYNNLAVLYSEKDQKHHTFLRGINAACRLNHFYQARRFYEKASKISKDGQEPCRLFLSYLQNASQEKLKKRIQLDLFAITGNEEDLPTKTDKTKKRLFVGEGDFSYTEALLKKHQKTHPNLGKSIVATDLYIVENEGINIRIQKLKEAGVEVKSGVDARSLHEFFKEQRFKRIHWNCPFKFQQDEKEEFKDVIPQFFKACNQLQKVKDRVHVTLVQNEDDSLDTWHTKNRQKQNPIVLGSASVGYRLIRKRVFGNQRYPGYRHVKSGRTTEYIEGGVEREFVFEKTGRSGSLKNPLELQDENEKKYKILSDRTDYVNESNEHIQIEKLKDSYFECSADEDSSDYYDSDE